MDMQAALRARLLGQTDAANRVTWVERPQLSALPAITLQTISGDRTRTHDGLQGTRETRVQVDCWAASYGASRKLVDQVVTRLAAPWMANGINFNAIFFEGERDFIDSVAGTSIYRTSIDLIVWHHPA